MKKIKEYSNDLNGKMKRKLEQKWMESRGWQVVQEEEESKFSGGKGCLYFIIFPPLIFFARSKKVKITYEK